MGPAVYINGKIFKKEEAMVNVYDHGFLYGDGVFEGIRTYNGRVFKLKEHIERLYQSARAIWLEIPMTYAEMTKAVEKTVETSGLRDGYVRIIVTRGVGNLGLDPRKTVAPQIIIISDVIQLYPQEYYEKGLDIITAATMRMHPAALNPRIKSLNYLNNIMAKIEAINAGCVEAVMLNHSGEVTECTGDNIFMIIGDQVLTPPLEAGILGGITRSVVLDLSRKAGYVTLEKTITRYDLYTADELFLTGSAAELIPVVRLDGRQVGKGKPGPIFNDLRKRFKDYTLNWE